MLAKSGLMIPYCTYVCYLAVFYYIPCTQYDIEALCDSVKDNRLEDAKQCLQNGVDVNGRDRVSNCLYLCLFLITINNF